MLRSYLVTHAVAVLSMLAALVPMFRVLRSGGRSSQSTLAWLLALVFVPLLAIPLYLLLGSRKFPRRAKLPGRPTESGVAPARAGHAFELLTTGESAYAALMARIDGATRTIDLTMFILGDDATGWAFVASLASRARRGVRVRVILDAVGCRRTLRRASRILAAAGAEVRAFMPLRHSPVRGRTNLRSHRKLAIFDGQQVFTGGMNLAEEYMGKDVPRAGPPRWRDVAAVTSGPAAEDAAEIFASDWHFCGGSTPPAVEPRPATAAPPAGDAVVQMVASGPDMATDTVYDLFLTGIFAARERIAIVTPYYVPDELLQHALVLAARRGVRTELLVPLRSNHRVADVARRSLLRELTGAGVLVHYYGAGMVHAKTMVIDDAFAYVGSPNFDMRSLFLNYECALCLYSPSAVGEVRRFVDDLVAECRDVAPPPGEHRALELIARLLAPEL